VKDVVQLWQQNFEKENYLFSKHLLGIVSHSIITSVMVLK
jgi:hypothetical protein